MIVMPAMTMFTAIDSEFCSMLMPTCTVRISVLFVTSSGQRYWFQAPMYV